MILRKFRINCIIRILFLSLSLFITIYLFFIIKQYLIAVMTASIVFYQIVSLIRYIERTNYYLVRFFDAVKYEDFSQSFSGLGLGRSFTELKRSFKDVLDKFQKSRMEKEEHFRRLQIVLNHIGTGLLSFQENGQIDLINNAAKRLFHMPRIRNINELSTVSKKLVTTLMTLHPGNKTLIKINHKDEVLNLSIYSTEFIMSKKCYKLISIQNIQRELEEKEMEAWQNLIRVLTHEIMNSVTPISSLAATVNGMLIQQSQQDSRDGDKIISIEDVQAAVQTIKKRSEGLLQFVESYRKLTRIPKPDIQIISVSSLFKRIEHLMVTDIKKKGIQFGTQISPESLELTADSALIEQTLINLIINAMDALQNSNTPKITLNAQLDSRSRTVIQVIDNGPGIDSNVQDRIFIPFFTTKKKGSGIGLSLCRQIMRMHKGTISIDSQPHKQTVVALRF